LKFLPLFLKKFEDFCKNLQFFEGFYTLRISPGLLVHVNPALFLVTPAKECHPWTLSPFPIRHPSESWDLPTRPQSGYQISPLHYL
jgi:hypothetical protein